MNTPKRHKFADVIHAWAEGNKVQVKFPGSKSWVDVEDPDWSSAELNGYAYRVKPLMVAKQFKYRRYITTDCYLKRPTMFFYWPGSSYEPEKGEGFIKWVDTDWIVEYHEIPEELT